MKISKKQLDILQCRFGWTNQQTAEHAGLKAQMYGLVKRRGTCSPKTVQALADVFGVDVTEILECEGES